MKTIEKIEECNWCKGKGYSDNTEYCGYGSAYDIIGEYGCSQCGGNGSMSYTGLGKSRDYHRGSGKVKNTYEVTSRNCVECNGTGKARYYKDVASKYLQNATPFGGFKNAKEEQAHINSLTIEKTCQRCNGLGKELHKINSKPVKNGSFVTTAICDILGKDDKCFELETLRKFRDNELLSNRELKKLVFEYYEISPELVNKIINHEDKYHFAQNLLNEHINIIIQTINQGDKFLAIKLYQEMLVTIEEN